jgi:hypothetical protein
MLTLYFIVFIAAEAASSEAEVVPRDSSDSSLKVGGVVPTAPTTVSSKSGCGMDSQVSNLLDQVRISSLKFVFKALHLLSESGVGVSVFCGCPLQKFV